MDLGEPTHTLVPCWMPKPLPPRNQCAGWFAPALGMLVEFTDLYSVFRILILEFSVKLQSSIFGIAKIIRTRELRKVKEDPHT